MEFDKAIIIRDKTRLEQLIERFNSKAQARFYLESSGGDFSYYEKEHERFYTALKESQRILKTQFKFKVLERSFLPSYIFSKQDLIIVIGQDGLVANTAKYVQGQPIISINPDPEQYDGVLLLYTAQTLAQALQNLSEDRFSIRNITMAEARLQDGQSLLAFNDFYIGSASHVSSRYEIHFEGRSENQSSSGIIVSTGAGSTGWLSSIFNMAYNIHKPVQPDLSPLGSQIAWEAKELIFVVREPFRSKVTGVDIGYGRIGANQSLKIISKMPTKGVIFSDGIEADFLHFNSGSQLEISIASEQARLLL